MFIAKNTRFFAQLAASAVLLSAVVCAPVLAAEEANASEQADLAKQISPKESMFKAGKAYFMRASDRFAETVFSGSEELINRSMQLIGVRYRWETELPQTGLDGSGFVAYVFKDKLGFLLPRKSTQISQVGTPISRDELQPGDLVFFNTMRLTFSHVGIYVGDNKFIHSPSKGADVRVDDLANLYWGNRFDGARRLVNGQTLDDAERKALLREVNRLKSESRSL
jgi:cell wall-associated NlpC family hydrolase